MAYLDETGLDYLWGKTKSLVSSSGGGGLTVLYDNSSGNSGTITCSDTLTNYQFLAIRVDPNSAASGGVTGTSLVCPICEDYFTAYKQGGVTMVRIKSITNTTVTIYPSYRIYQIWGLK